MLPYIPVGSKLKNLLGARLLHLLVHEKLLRNRNSDPEVFCEKGVLRNFAKFTGKQLCQSLFLNKVAGMRYATLLKKGSGTGVFL